MSYRIDTYSKVHWFKTLKGAQKFIDRWNLKVQLESAKKSYKDIKEDPQ